VPEGELGPLPGGRHGLSREQVAHSQRERLIAGFAQAVVEHGYSDVTIEHVTKAARVSRRAFYANFKGKEEAFLAVLDAVAAHLRELILEAIAPIEDWPRRVVVALRVVLRFFAAEPDLARLCTVDSLSAGNTVARRFQEALREFEPLLAQGRADRQGPRPLPDSSEASLIGAVASEVSRSVCLGEGDRLEELVPDFAEFLLLPYVGATEARRLARDAAKRT
jgi:AcrR family transcriptional regulator